MSDQLFYLYWRKKIDLKQWYLMEKPLSLETHRDCQEIAKIIFEYGSTNVWFFKTIHYQFVLVRNDIVVRINDMTRNHNDIYAAIEFYKNKNSSSIEYVGENSEIFSQTEAEDYLINAYQKSLKVKQEYEVEMRVKLLKKIDFIPQQICYYEDNISSHILQ